MRCKAESSMLARLPYPQATRVPACRASVMSNVAALFGGASRCLGCSTEQGTHLICTWYAAGCQSRGLCMARTVTMPFLASSQPSGHYWDRRRVCRTAESLMLSLADHTTPPPTPGPTSPEPN